MLTGTQYQNIICNLEQVIICGENNYKELLYANNTLFTLPVSTVQQNIFSLSLTNVVDDLSLFNDTLSEIDIFVDRLQKYIIINYGNLNSFLSNNHIIVPRRVASISNKLGYAISNDHIGYCSYSGGIGSSSSSISFIKSVIRLSETDLLWNFNFDIIGTSITLNNLIPLTVNNLSPTAIMDFDSQLIVLKYAINTATTWVLKTPCNLLFTNGQVVTMEETGSID